eukprot:gnl/TRDRNA2_/TRDRNA2_160002_c0_seq1.p1 gnl/TRDRNA2_/TRDRNA2_160002_c0~~gnl/TRDRNA2_/TRDRNA2_160002_c0_seq1.p1  ORF type:complete len:333 (+),score=53.52 gnl/TRDRNA2_/TRDRNA2_160002_c0_seq1:122-1000(+)
MAADAQPGGVDLMKLEDLWQRLIRHQLLLIKDEVLKFTSKIPTSVRRILRNDPRWRDIIQFPGEDASAMEKRRTARAMRVWRTKLVWVMIGDGTMEAKHRLGVCMWNVLLMFLSWWLFGFDKFQSIQALLVSVVLMCLTSLLRLADWKYYWEHIPTKDKIYERLPPREQVDEWANRAWDFLCLVGEKLQLAAVFSQEEYKKLRAKGSKQYFDEAQTRFYHWWDARQAAAAAQAELEREAEDAEAKRRKTAGIASKINKLLEEREEKGTGGGGRAAAVASDDRKNRPRGGRRR